MRVTTIDRYLPAPGTLAQWTVRASIDRARESHIPPSFNQSMHLAHADRGNTWLATSFEIAGSIDLDALERAFRGLTARHPGLRTSFERTDDGVRRLLHAEPLHLHRQPDVEATTEEDMRGLLWQALNRRCRPDTFPAYLLGAILRPDTSTVICGFDHALVDAYSMPIIVEDVRRLYQGFRLETLPTTGSFVEYCADEAASTVHADDPRLRLWREFFGPGEAIPPSFPIDLGLEPGTKAPQAVDLRRVLCADAVQRFERVCRDNGAGMLAGCLVALAHSLDAVSGSPRMRVLFPMHTRNRDEWRNAVGWFVSNAPVEVVATPDIDTALRRTGRAVRAAVDAGTAPLGDVVRSLGGLRMVRDDVFMVSYLDYRRLPGAEHHRRIAAHHISNVSSADDVQLWLSRTDEGLFLRSRFPDTRRAQAVLTDVLDEFERVLGRLGEPSSRTHVVRTAAQPVDARPAAERLSQRQEVRR